MSNITISLGNEGNVREPRKKGKSLLSFPDNYIVLDIETTGLDPYYDEIIEIGALKINSDKIVDQFSTLVKPEKPIDDFITNLTGITDEMVSNAPNIRDILPSFLAFTGDSAIVGHHVHFDINFIYDKTMEHFGTCFENNFIDTLKLSKRLFPLMKSYRLTDLVRDFNINAKPNHRALADCASTYELFSFFKEHALKQDIDLKAALGSHSVKSKDIQTNKTLFDDSHPLFQKECVITGKLEKKLRKEAMQIIADLGGINSDNVTMNTNYLILGNNSYCPTIKDGKSTKQKKAEKYILAGYDLSIISENVFYDIIEDA